MLVYSGGHSCLVESFGNASSSVTLWYSFGLKVVGKSQSVNTFLESREATLTVGHRALLSNVDEAWFLKAIGDQQRKARWLASNPVASATEAQARQKKQKVEQYTRLYNAIRQYHAVLDRRDASNLIDSCPLLARDGFRLDVLALLVFGLAESSQF